jgi:hypothetical protein
MTPRLLLLTALALAALPAAAHASTVELRPDGTLLYTGAPGAPSDLRVTAEGPSGVRLHDPYDPPTLVGGGCVEVLDGITCSSGVARVELQLGDNKDSYYHAHGLPTVVDGGPGSDSYTFGAEFGATASRAEFRGGPGEDSASYYAAGASVTVSKDDVANDGRAGDADNIHADVEWLEGTPKDDTLIGNANHGTTFDGGYGDDVLDGVGGRNVFAAREHADGADVIRGGTGVDELDYTDRREPLDVSVDGGSHDDGAAGEGDDVTGVEIVDGGAAGDVIGAGGHASLEAYGGGGNDILTGGPADDYLDGEIGADTVSGGPGADTIHAADAVRDRVDCGGGRGDWVWRDKHERTLSGCRAAGTLDLQANKVSMRLTWTQPGGWKHLRRLTISALKHGRTWGEIRLDPRRKRLTAAGEAVLRRGWSVTRSGDRVSATFRYTLGPASIDRIYYRVDALGTE